MWSVAVLLAAGLSLAFPPAPLSAQSALQDRFFDSSGVRIRYLEAGTGTPIVLVHGFTRNIETNWIDTGVLWALAKRHRVIAVDLRGHGKSGKPHDPKAYEADVHLDVVKLMDHLQIPRAHLVGYSAGCSVIGRLAVTHPERVISVVLGAGTILHGVWEASDDENAKRAAADVKNDPPFRNLIVRLTPKDETPRSEDTIKAQSSQLTAGNDLDALMAYRAAGGRGQLSSDEDVMAIRVPVLAIVGDQDPTIAAVRSFQKFFPAVNVIEIEGATHASERSAVRQPRFAAAILEFVADRK
jgi:pimeloyl-ACP methyl ester carboxylesterase